MNSKPKIVFIIDVDYWAFAIEAKKMKEMLNESYDIDIIPITYLKENIVRLILLIQKYDLVHFFWRGAISIVDNDLTKEYILSLGSDVEGFIEEKVLNLNISTCIPDHMFIDENFEITEDIMKYTNNYYVTSNKLFDIYNNLEIKKPYGVITGAIDLERFKPVNLERFNNLEKRKIIIGWVGNSAWGKSGKDHKGFHTIVEPAVNELKAEGYNIELLEADRNKTYIPYDEMSDYYNKIDIYICSSLSEGIPHTIFEAVAMGIPIITTDVGIVNEVLGEKQRKMILKERTVDCLKEKIKELLNNLNLFAELSLENIEAKKYNTWEYRIKEFKEYFDYCINSKK